MKKTSILSRYLALLLEALLLSSLIIPIRYDIPYPQTLGTQFDAIVKMEYARAISKTKPDIILIGDSVIHYGVDQQTLTKQLNIETYKIAIRGSASAVWYLILKNIVLPAKHHPKYIVIFFRDTELTLPAFLTTGSYFELLDDFASPHEPLVTELVFVNQMSPAERLAEQYIPLYSTRWKIRKQIDNHLRYGASATLLRCLEPCTDQALNSIFGKQGVDVVALNQAVEDSQKSLYTPAALNFDHQIEKSFLPPIIRLAQENNIGVIFVRTKNLIYPEYTSEPSALHTYINSLEKYLSQQENIFFLDFAHDTKIQKSYFFDVLHFNTTGKITFTQILANKLMPLIK